MAATRAECLRSDLRRLGLGLSLILSASRLGAQPAMVSPEIRVAAKLGFLDQSPALASNGLDRLVVTWCRTPAEPFDDRWLPLSAHSIVLARVFDGSGKPLGPELPVAEASGVDDCLPTLAMDPQGGFVVTWTRSLPSDEGSYWVRFLARRFDREGRPQGGEIRLDPRQHYYFPAQIAMDAAGRFVVGWIEARSSQDFTQVVRLRRFDAEGQALGVPFELEPESRDFASGLSLAMSPEGRLLVAWATLDPASIYDGIAVRLLDAEGERVGDRAFVSSSAALSARRPGAVADPNGGFWVAWVGDSGAIVGRRLDAAGHPLGSGLEISEGTAEFFERLPLAVGSAGDLFAFWPGPAIQYVDQTYGQSLGADGARRGSAFPVVSDGQRVGGAVQVAATSAGRFALIWERSYYLNIYGPIYTEVVLRLFRTPPSGDEPCFLDRGSFDQGSFGQGSFACDTLRNGRVAELVAPIDGAPEGVPLLGDLDGDGRDELCVAAPPSFACDLDHDLALFETPLTFGAPGDTPLLGDLNGDGRADLCVARAGLFDCDTAHNGGSGEVRITFGGAPGEIPLLGDVDGDGDDDPCVYAQGRLLCDTAHDGLVAEFAESFGSAGSVPFLADVDGDGRAELCVRQDNAFLCDTGHDGGASERTIPFDRPTGLPFFGNADGY